MKFVVDTGEYEYPEDPTNRDVMDLEEVTGLTYAEWSAELTRGSTAALTALIYFVRKADEPALKIDDVTFSMKSLKAIYTDDEALSIYEAMDEDERPGFLERLPEEQRRLVEREVPPTVPHPA